MVDLTFPFLGDINTIYLPVEMNWLLNGTQPRTSCVGLGNYSMNPVLCGTGNQTPCVLGK